MRDITTNTCAWLLILAPFSTNSRTTVRWPASDATCRGSFPLYNDTSPTTRARHVDEYITRYRTPKVGPEGRSRKKCIYSIREDYSHLKTTLIDATRSAKIETSGATL